ncbi:GNAT family N-acetyltransferase [Polyangium mundeleinium]|uniref:GNAT family N-acetyltransferase n=1 Tax=Polyangium mundeleinium TaxID=2995306 RepID=A0ABT5F1F5_9BACT|nr:GNAT family N-acetyltransferase [Polyangium mundeleinium]MDC0747434.1 GNAT family N-acetyltransferase [Polyangium mundeleinium]
MTDPFSFRPIRPEDDPAIAAIIRAVMPEFGADGPGFAIHDPEVSAMSVAYSGPRSAYFVVEMDGRVVGGAGIGPLEGGDADTAELRKMYFLREARGKGMGERLLQHILGVARERGFARVYLETLTGMDSAMRLYERLGFRRLDRQLGSTGHHGCNRFYMRDLVPAVTT